MKESTLTTTGNLFVPTENYHSIKFYVDTEVLLEISPNGFYVRGNRVNQDDNEAEIVYNTFHKWLTFVTLTR